MEIEPEFKGLVDNYLADMLDSAAEHKVLKLPETTLIFPWIGSHAYSQKPSTFTWCRILGRPESVGRWKSDKGKHDFNFFAPAMAESDYLL